MFDNHTYNLMNQLVQEHKSLWRIKDEYMEDTDDCPECLAFWEKMVADKAEHIRELTELVKTHLAIESEAGEEEEDEGGEPIEPAEE